MRVLRLTASYIVFFYFLIQIQRKLRISGDALQFLAAHRRDTSEESFEASLQLKNALNERRSPAVLLLNKYALNITLNFLCNVASFPDVSERLLIFAFDHSSYNTIHRSFSNITVLYWPIRPFMTAFRQGDSAYQFFQLFRANLAAYLSVRTESFWMIQSDTLWRKNLFEVIDPKKYLKNGENIILDQEGTDGLLSKMVAGGYFYAKAGAKTQKFFRNLASNLNNYYLTDNNVMSQMCITEFEGNKCAFIPYRLVLKVYLRRVTNEQI
ncbi:hypothetical protein L596_016403 [Steinernema carpocapsae]|uniref:Nucleotide-diphospho-sugar transferase domain-containing protein n=1 Tax=Steinernema carpocapsae TaxID=34508 RepID=A0A4U5NIV0_STECR|nr:hypothetical protein L596_016403 [Steinernema carpocapsae]